MMEGLLNIALNAAVKGSAEILKVYGTEDFETIVKKDNSPLTEADLNSNKAISKILKTTNIPILSEEDALTSYSLRRKWDYFWLIDPLDGTKEFITRNGEFTVNIALIRKNTPVLGVIYVPVTGDVYFAMQGCGAFKTNIVCDVIPFKIADNSQKLPLGVERFVYTVVASRSHSNKDTEKFIKKIEKAKKKINLISRGSSLKICMVAEGAADIYPRFGPTMEWDTAAGHAIAVEAGCTFTQPDGAPLLYNKEDLLNPFFIVKRA